MPDRILYYPHINIPNSAWFVRMLLYWDQIGTITPLSYLEEPDRFSPVTQRLIQEGLVHPIIPGHLVNSIDGFSSVFEEFIEGIDGRKIRARQQKFARLLVERASNSDRPPKVHFEKLGDLGSFLVRRKLAKKSRKWYFVESATAAEFMTYLASCLGKSGDKEFFPMTNSKTQIETIVNSSLNRAEAKIRPIRLQVIDRLFPVPKGRVTANDLVIFKNRNRGKLKTFRRNVEKQLLQIAAIADSDLRKRAITELHNQIDDDLNDIEDKIQRRFGKGASTLGKVCFGVAAELSKSVGIIKAISDATKTSKSDEDNPMLYAAYARAQLDLVEDGTD